MRQSPDTGSLGVEDKHTHLPGSSCHSLGQKGPCLHSPHTHPSSWSCLHLPTVPFPGEVRVTLSANCFRTTQPAGPSPPVSPSPCPHRAGCAPGEAGVLFHSRAEETSHLVTHSSVSHPCFSESPASPLALTLLGLVLSPPT